MVNMERIIIKRKPHSEETKRKISIGNCKIKVHGKTYHRLYQIWKSMLNRCESPSNTNYFRYGARGIKVCKRWHDINKFIDDIDPIWFPRAHLDRINNNKGYFPKNVRVVTAKENSNNRRNTRHVCIDGIKLSLTEWSEIIGVERHTLWNRLQRGLKRK